MEKWLKAKYFTTDLEVRSQDDPQHLPLALHFLREQRNPFTEVPLQQWLAVPVLTEFQTALLQVTRH
jgi:nitrate reductase assembly molybdenum cofactor insertion protein NarJ